MARRKTDWFQTLGATLKSRLAWGMALGIGMGCATRQSSAEPVFGLDATGAHIVIFDTASSGTLSADRTITGLAAGEKITGIDFRGFTSQLYGISNQNRIYTISLASGGAVATQVGTDGGFALSGSVAGFDISPAFSGAIRVTTSDGTNIRINPDDGTLVATDGAPSYAPADPNFGLAPDIVGVAHDKNNRITFGTVTLYGIDAAQNVLVRQNQITGALQTVGFLGITAGPASGFDISGMTTNAYLHDGGLGLYTVDLATGAATSVGTSGISLSGIAVLPNVPLHWDIDANTAGVGGSGIWSTTAANWTYDAAGTGPNFGWINGPIGVSAVFRGVPGIVTAESGLTIGSLTFESDGYVIQGSDPIDYRGSIINVMNAGHTATIAADLHSSGIGSIVKMGAGKLRLTGEVTLPTGTSVIEGILAIDGGTLAAPGSLTLNLTAGLEIINGGFAQTGQGIVGEMEGAESTAVIAGPSSRWENTGLLVGYAGNGTLSILNGARVVTDGFASTALQAFGLNTAAVTVDGAGSLWFVRDHLAVGAWGTATMRIQNGGVVDSGDHSALAVGPTAVAHVTVDGEGSLWSIAGAFEVATAGSGTLDITNKGKVSVVSNGAIESVMSIGGLSNLGFGPPAQGTVNVIGDGSLLSVEGDLSVGTVGHGRLHVLHGGLVETGGSAAIGYDMLEFGDEIYRGTGEAIVDGTESRWNVGEVLHVGFHGNGDLTVSNGGVVTSGAISVGTEEESEGYIYIGDGGAPGILDTSIITGGAGMAWVVFNHHAASYEFIPELSGTVALWHLGEGTTVLPYSNSFSGGTYIDAGRLVTQDAEALGRGYAEITGGALAPVGTLEVERLYWTGGRVALAPVRQDLLVVTNDIENGGAGGDFEIDPTGLQLETTYTLATFGSTNLSLQDLRAVSANPHVSYAYEFQLNDHDVKLAILGATASGPLLQNGAPGYVPIFAHFTVNGPVVTGPGEDTVIQSLTFNNGGALQVNHTLTVDTGNFTVPGGMARISGGRVIVPGDFHKLGGGALVANAHFQVEGNSFIQSGVLHVNGSFHTPLFHVLPNGTLKGNGLIVGDVLNHGTVAPGNSIGTLSIRGDYTQAHHGALEIEVGGLNHYDVLVVSGTARLGGTLEIQDAGHDFDYGDQFAFLRAGRITGRFDRIVMPDPDRLRGRFFTAGGTGVLLVAPSSYTLVAQTDNQVRVARALDRWIGIEEGDIGEVTLGLDMLREEQYPDAFESIMPGRYAAAVELSAELAHSQLQGLHQQFASRRLEKQAWRERPSSKDTSMDASIIDGKAAKAVVPVREPIAPVETSGWRAWTQASGLFSQTSWGTTPDDDFESGGFMAGADLAVSEAVSLGLFAGYQFGEGDYPGRNELELEKFSFGGYATFDGEHFYAHAVVGGGATEYEVTRAIVLPTLSRAAHSDVEGHEFFASFGLGHDMVVGDFTFGPSLTVQYNRQSLDAVDERGAGSLDLALDDASVDSLRTYLGARAAYTVRLGESSAIIPEVRAFWQHEFLQDGETFHASLDGGAGPGFDYVTEDPERDALFAGAGFNLLLGSQFSTSVFYHAEFGRTDEVNHTVSVNASWKF